jgi:hypothetical protein
MFSNKDRAAFDHKLVENFRFSDSLPIMTPFAVWIANGKDFHPKSCPNTNFFRAIVHKATNDKSKNRARDVLPQDVRGLDVNIW